jgi:glycosyltransferase involved in cell wall biosynthesis
MTGAVQPALRVAVFSNSYQPRLVGPSIAIDNLRTTTRDTAEWLVIAPEYRSMFARRPADPGIVRVPSYRQWGVDSWALPIEPAARIAVRRALDAFRPDVIHVHQPFALGVCGLTEARRRDVPVVYTFHTHYDHYAHYATRVASGVAGAWVQRRLPAFIDSVDHVVVPTSAIARELRAQGVATPLSTIPTGVATAHFRADAAARARVRAALGVTDGQMLLLHVGRVVKEKRVDFLLRALAQLRTHGDDCVLAIVGSGTQAAALRRLAKAMALEASVRWVGLVQHAALPDYYAAADLFAFASISDTQAIVLYEALAAGLPIVAVASQAAHAAVRQARHGIVAADDPEAFAAAVRRARASLGAFQPALDERVELGATVNRYLQLYRHVAEHGPRARVALGDATESA